MKKTLKKTLKGKIKRGLIFASIPIVFGLNSCGKSGTDNFYKEGTYEGYPVKISKHGSYRKMFIGYENNNISAQDYDNERFDHIELNYSKGDGLEKLANIESLERAYAYVKETGGKN